MKKFLLFSLVLPGFLMSSCLKDEQEKNPVTQGSWAYFVVHDQNIYSMDAASVAFRLNLLLAEAEKQEMSNLDEVVVKLDDEDESFVKLKKHLFDNNKITADTERPGYYTLKYESNSVGNNDLLRHGEIVINTKGKLLGELGDGESWDIYGNNTNADYSYIAQYLKSELRIVLPNGTNGMYSIYGTASPNTWRIRIDNFDSYLRGRPERELRSKWNIDFVISQDKGDQSFEGTSAAKYSVDGTAQGVPVGWVTITASYIIKKPLEYKSECFKNALYPTGGGAEKVTINGSLEQLGLESDVVNMEWEHKNDCYVMAVIRYNGWIYNYITGELEKEGGQAAS